MADYQTLSIVLTGIGMIIALIYYSLQIRNQNKTRRAQLFMDLFNLLHSQTSFKHRTAVEDLEFTDFEEFMERYGPATNPEIWSMINSVLWTFAELGSMHWKGMISIEDIIHLLNIRPLVIWKKYEPIIKQLRDERWDGSGYENFEYLAAMIQKAIDDGTVDREISMLHAEIRKVFNP